MAERIELTGRRFGRLVVRGYRDHSHGHARWDCDCDCGGTSVVFGFNLRKGKTYSCGCARKETAAATARRNAKHGMTDTTEFRIWSGMRTRCFNPNDHAYRNYGGRGITMCDRWRDDFLAFYRDMGPFPGPGYSVERIDNDGDYESGNCRWIPKREQTRNTRMSVIVELDGRRQCAAVWAREVGISAGVIIARLRKGASPREALTRPLRRPRQIEFGGERMTIVEWSKKLGVSAEMIRDRLARGWSPKDALSKKRCSECGRAMRLKKSNADRSWHSECDPTLPPRRSCAACGKPMQRSCTRPWHTRCTPKGGRARSAR